MTQMYGRSVECTVLTNILADRNRIQLLHRFESNMTFSFTSNDNIYLVAALLKVGYCKHSKGVIPKFISSATSGISQNLSLCSLCKNIDVINNIRVSVLNTLAYFIRVPILMSFIVKYIKNTFSLLRSKIRELHPVYTATLEALLQHLLRVASHSDKNGMTVNVLSTQFCKYVLGLDKITTNGVHVKARYVYLS
jgi:hypothetical protein